jgi:protein-S-isoprenylcysteine O-methyltransferase Ste14
MNHNDPFHLLILAASWLLFAISHSLLVGTTLNRLFGRYSRLVFNCLAVVIVLLPFAISAQLPAYLLWDEPEWLGWIRHGVSVVVALAFFHTLKFYSLPGFLGLKAETWALTFSPWHRWVRHPWYFLALILIWTHTMTETWLVTALCITLYLVIGSRIEEKRILRYHPDSYADYCRIVPGLIPWRGCALDEATRIELESRAVDEAG